MVAATLSDLNKIGFIRGYQAVADIAKDANKPIPSPGNIPKILQTHQKKARPGSRKRHEEKQKELPDITATITPPPVKRGPNPWEMLFPPIGIIDLWRSGGNIPTEPSPLPDITIKGPPDEILPNLPSYTPPPSTGGNGGGFDLSGSLDMVGKIIPLFLVLAIVGAVKKLM